MNRTLPALLLVVVIVVGLVSVVLAALFAGPALAVTKTNFAPYSTPVSQSSNSPSSMTVSDTNGGVTVSPWPNAYLMINGTITARGFGTSTSAITFVESNSSRRVVFQAVFPPGGNFFFGASYSVDINVFVPASAQLDVLQVVTVNGNIQVSNISASSLVLTVTNGNVAASGIPATILAMTDKNGDVDFTCASCASVLATTTNGNVSGDLGSLSLYGDYSLMTTNGNVDLRVPAVASFKITANTTNGSVSSSGLGVQLTNHVMSTFGSATFGSAAVNLTTTNGSVTVTGN